MPKITTITLFILLILQNVLAQNFIVSPSVYDFGRVENFKNLPAVFVFTNNTGKAQYILAPKTGRQVWIEYPKRKILPNESDTIKVYYYTGNIGRFTENIQLYISGSFQPIEIGIKGNIQSIAVNALTLCPTFGPKKDQKEDKYKVDLVVIDAVTEEPVKNAKVALAFSGVKYTNTRGSTKFQPNLGKYKISITKDDYLPQIGYISFRLSQNRYVFELMPTVRQSVAVENDIIPNNDTNKIASTVNADSIYITPINKDSLYNIEDDNPDFSFKKYAANNVVFLIDVSGSMRRRHRMDSLKTAMQVLVSMLRSVDFTSIITFATETEMPLNATSGSKKDKILGIINKLEPGGTTNGVLGLKDAYKIAKQNFIVGGNNQIFIVTDGRFSGGEATTQQSIEIVTSNSRSGIILSVVGFGQSDEAVALMKKLANLGEGNYIDMASDNQNNYDKLKQEIRQNSLR